MTALDALLIIGAFVLILFGAEMFTNGVEWLGVKLNMTEGATGSILAAFGTATYMAPSQSVGSSPFSDRAPRHQSY